MDLSILTPQLRWYYKNREKAIENAKKWRLAHPERYRAIQKAAKQRKRKAQKVEQVVKWWENPAPALPLAPEGYDPICGETIDEWCLQRGLSRDPRDW